MKKRFLVFFLVLIYLFNNIFVSTTFGRFVQESTSEKFNVSATAQSQPKSLSESSWQEIYDITVSGKAKDYWKVGDKTTVNVNGEDKEVVIIGFDHDGKNTVTFLFKDAVTIAPMNIEMTTVGGWKESDMRKITLPTILDSMGNKDFIKEVEKNTIKGYTDGGGIVTGDIPQNAYDSISTTDKLFLLSYAEVFDSCYWDGEGVLYEYFNTTSNHIMTNENGNATWWWLRTPVINIEAYFYFVNSAGVSSTHLTNYSGSVMPAFVIGETTEEVNTLDLLPPFEMPEEFVAGESFIISEMPDFQVITENAMKVIPENTEFYGWLIENELAQEIFELEDAEYILEDTYSYGEEVELRLTPVYKKVEESKLIAVDINDLVNIIIENLTENTISNEQDFTFKFVAGEGYEIPETIEVLLNGTSYIVNTNGEENPDGFTFNVETFELTISSDILSDKETLTIKATASEIIKEVVEMLDGDGSEYDINSPETLVFRSEAPLTDLKAVQVNGEDLNPETDYTATEGSTIITLSEEYLSTLEIGEYTISIISTRMIANATFTVDKIVEEKESNTENTEEISDNETDKELPEDTEKEKDKSEEILEKIIKIDTEQLYNIEITEFANFEEDEEKEIVIEENLELEFVLEEDYVLYKNIDILIDDTQYVLDITDEEQELEGITFDVEENVLTIDFELFEENSNLVIKAIALENIPLDKLVEGKEISITELLEVEEILESIDIPENTEFVGWLINGEELEINNIVIQEILNDILTKIYSEIEQEKVQDENVLDDFEEESTEEMEEIETLLTPIFRLIKEEVNLDGYTLGEETTIFEIPNETVLEELIASGLTEELMFYGWLVDTELKVQIVSQEELFEKLTEIFESEEEIILTPLYTVVETTEEQPDDVEENENTESEENIEEETIPESTEKSDNQEVVPEESIQDPETSVNEKEIGETPEISIPTEQTLYINTNNLVNISIPELSNENTISIANNENLVFSLETEEGYKLSETVHVVIDKTYTVNTNEKGSPEDGVTFNVSTGEITISNSLLLGIETITLKGAAVKIEKEDTETTQKETSTEKVESSENQSSDEKETVNEQTPNEELETDNIPENSENTVTEPTNTNSEENDTETDIEASLEDQEQSNETENTEQDATDIEDLSKNEETDNVSTENETEENNEVQNESSTESNSNELENNFVDKGEIDKTDTSTGVAEESSSKEQSSTESNNPETSPISTEPAVQSPTSTNTSTQTNSASNSSSESSPDTRTSNSSGNSDTGNQSGSNSTGTSSSGTTTTKKLETSNETSDSETSSSEE